MIPPADRSAGAATLVAALDDIAVPPLEVLAVSSPPHWLQASSPSSLLGPRATPHPLQFREHSWYFYNKLQGNQFRIKTEDEAKIGFQERNY